MKFLYEQIERVAKSAESANVRAQLALSVGHSVPIYAPYLQADRGCKSVAERMMDGGQ